MKKIIRTEVHEADRFMAFLPRLVNIIMGVLISFLMIRLFLKLFGANEQNAIVNFLYSLTAVFIKPFRSIFENITLDKNMILELNTLVAILVYALIAWIIMNLFMSFTGQKIKEEYIDYE